MLTLSRVRHVQPIELPVRARAAVADLRALLPRRPPQLGPARWLSPLTRPDGAARDTLAAAVHRWRSDPQMLGGPVPPWSPEPGWAQRPAWTIPWRRHNIRPTWERHRLLHVQRLALAGLWLDDPHATHSAQRELDDYLQHNPPGRGVGWTSALEVAHRTVSLLLLRRLLDAPVDDHLARAGHHLATHPSLGSSLGNHTVGEAAALVTLACLAPRLPGAEGWRALGLTRLAHASPRVLSADGHGRELATGYTAAVLEWCLIARAAHGPLPADRCLARAAAALSAWCDLGGPDRGDRDGSCVLDGGDASTRSIAGCAASAMGVPGPTGWVPDGRAALLELGPCPPGAQGVRTTGGWTSLSQLIDGVRWTVLVGLGPTGFPPLASHGHDDGGSVWLSVGDTPVLVDRGTPIYAGDLRLRAWCRGAAAHSVPLLDGHGPAEPTGVFGWRRQGQTRLISRTDTQVCVRIEGWPGRAILRTIQLGPEGLTLHDRVVGRPARHAAVSLHLPLGARIADAIYIGGLSPLRLTSDLDPAVLPTAHAEGYNRTASAPTLRLTTTRNSWRMNLAPHSMRS
ncbi:MAG: hypothetical protein ACI9K2_001814 [Myxococcota bacterium]